MNCVVRVENRKSCETSGVHTCNWYTHMPGFPTKTVIVSREYTIFIKMEFFEIVDIL